jgi:hypothetical protein
MQCSLDVYDEFFNGVFLPGGTYLLMSSCSRVLARSMLPPPVAGSGPRSTAHANHSKTAFLKLLLRRQRSVMRQGAHCRDMSF